MEPLDAVLPVLPGAEELCLPAGTPPHRYVARGADLVLVVLAGDPCVGVGTASPRRRPAGSAVVCPRGVPWSVGGGEEPARVVAVGFPSGPERTLTALVGPPPLDGAALVAAAADGGLEVVLEPLPPPVDRPGRAGVRSGAGQRGRQGGDHHQQEEDHGHREDHPPAARAE
ncbi:hypothetical protein SAMN04488107_4111 [Geodermatophilus saharensis]|uniref:Uncharacterized protein n=1 Tax=Geodermatophilus saharensis TaxID=1137994 RepID=A0A239I2I3_9ACTN|nr:hypothetical protein [Geodermatophilus saharensis]SNS87582.1 hypothetical protein SAMN04488107_4111 [Geodermatophilus saharensis]